MSWHHAAACKGQPAWLDKTPALQRADCARCPVRIECLAYAIKTQSTGVTMGGISIGTRPLQGEIKK